MFDIGFRGSRPVDLARAGTGGGGLGLAVTRRIVEAHRGSVGVANTATGLCRRDRAAPGLTTVEPARPTTADEPFAFRKRSVRPAGPTGPYRERP